MINTDVASQTTKMYFCDFFFFQVTRQTCTNLMAVVIKSAVTVNFRIHSLAKDGCEKTELENLLRTSDFVSIHAKLTPETNHMLNAERLAIMKTSAVIVNTARGEISDEKALHDALSERRIVSAALDVFEEDPVKQDNPLLRLENVTVTPHTAGRSPEVERRGYQQVAEATAKYLRGEEIKRAQIANPKVLER